MLLSPTLMPISCKEMTDLRRGLELSFSRFTRYFDAVCHRVMLQAARGVRCSTGDATQVFILEQARGRLWSGERENMQPILGGVDFKKIQPFLVYNSELPSL
jgi:hypothetical protein